MLHKNLVFTHLFLMDLFGCKKHKVYIITNSLIAYHIITGNKDSFLALIYIIKVYFLKYNIFFKNCIDLSG